MGAPLGLLAVIERARRCGHTEEAVFRPTVGIRVRPGTYQHTLAHKASAATDGGKRKTNVDAAAPPTRVTNGRCGCRCLHSKRHLLHILHYEASFNFFVAPRANCHRCKQCLGASPSSSVVFVARSVTATRTGREEIDPVRTACRTVVARGPQFLFLSFVFPRFFTFFSFRRFVRARCSLTEV